MQIGAWLALVILAAVVSGAAAQQAAPAADTGVVALLRKHDEAMKQQDLEAIMKLFAPGEKTVMIGTGPGERWVGKDEIRSAYVEFFKDFDKGSLTRTCEWTTGEARKEMAWGVAMCSMSDSLKERKRSFELNVSAVAGNQRGQWLFRSLHFSNLTGPVQPSPGK